MGNEHEVRIKLLGKVGLDSTEAQAEYRKLLSSAQQSEQVAVPGGPPPAASQRANSLLTSQFGQNFSYLQNRRNISALIRQEHQHVRDLTEQYGKLKETQDGHSKQQQAHIKTQIDSHRSLAHSLRTFQMAGEAQEMGSRSRNSFMRTGGRPRQFMFGQMSLGQALHGGAITASSGGLSRSIMGNPYLATIAAIVGGPALAYHFANKSSELSEGIQTSYLNVARGTGEGSLQPALGGTLNRGRIDERLLRMGFTHTNTSRMARAFGLRTPGVTGGTAGSLMTHAEFARAFGFGDQPEMISGVGRQMTLMGMQPNRQTTFWRQMGEVVKRGQKEGVDASDTLKAMVTILGTVAQNTGLLTGDRAQRTMSMATALGRGGRFFQGERGAQRIQQLMGSVQNPQSMQGRVLLQNAIRQEFGGVPSALDLGLMEDQREAYNALTPVQRINYVMQNIQSLPGGLAGRVFGRIGRGTTPQMRALMFQSMTGMNESQTMEAMMALNRAGGKGGGSPFENLERVMGPFGPGFGATMGVLGAGSERIATDTSPVERARSAVRARHEEMSDIVSRGTVSLRTEIKEGFEQAISNTIIESIKLFNDPVGTITEGVKEGNKELMEEFLKMVPFGGHFLERSDDSAVRNEGAVDRALP